MFIYTCSQHWSCCNFMNGRHNSQIKFKVVESVNIKYLPLTLESGSFYPQICTEAISKNLLKSSNE